MKANNLTISIPTEDCKKNCPYCISKMTYGVKPNPILFRENLEKLTLLANRVGVSHILITGKGEPFDNVDMLKTVFSWIHRSFPIEIQTHLRDFNREQLDLLRFLDVMAISIDKPEDLDDVGHWQELTSHKWITRLAVILSRRFERYKLRWFIDKCLELGIDQLTIRQPTIPRKAIATPESHKTQQWIREKAWPELYQMNIIDELEKYKASGDAAWIRDLLFGSVVYDIAGIGFTHMEYCVESQNGDVMRSLIYQADGHLYTTWDHRGSIIF